VNADAIVLASYTRKKTGDLDVRVTAKSLQSECAVFTATPAEDDAHGGQGAGSVPERFALARRDGRY
jgi:hypothetical protein